MSEKTLKITLDDTLDDSVNLDDRFQRFSLIGWWDQQRIRNAKIAVIGAGALGNEIIKNLALLGVGNLLIADLDNIENSNLSRSVLFRKNNNGNSKAEIAAKSAKDIFPDINVHSFHGNIIYDLGVGVYNWADLVIGGLDNREARLSINRSCWKVNKPWIDGAIEQISGCARVFVPDGPCYECTMSDTDWTLLNHRRSCNLLSRNEMQEGKVPTTPTISAVIAGVQCQEAIKLLHGMETIAGKGFMFNGISADSYLIDYQKKEDCYSHDIAEHIYSINNRSDETPIGELLEVAKERLGNDTVLELGRDVLESLYCHSCKKNQPLYCSLGQVNKSITDCPECGQHREVRTFFTITGKERFLDKTFAEIGVPKFDILWARNNERLIGFEFSGDANDVLGPLSHNKSGENSP